MNGGHSDARTGTIQRRLSVLSRIAAAVFGAYGLTALIAMLLSQGLILAGMGQAQAVLAATIPAFLIYAALVCAIFHTRSARRAWARIVGAALPAALLVWWLAQGFSA